MINVFVLKKEHTVLADEKSEILENIELILKSNSSVNLNCSMDEADALIIQEEFSFKNFRYVRSLKNDPVFRKYANKIFTINTDDCATGLVKGFYTSLPKKRYDPKVHLILPYLWMPNELILNKEQEVTPAYLATWRGNSKSNRIRNKIVKLFSNVAAFDIHPTKSWFNHSVEEKQLYKNSLMNAKFSLCPGGWAPVTFRIYESMAVGRCPVILADQFVPPVGPDWESFSIFVSENKVSQLKEIIQEKEHLYQELGEKAYQAWLTFFSPSNVYSHYSQTLVDLIESTNLSNVRSEFERWESFSMYVNNSWTIPQRLMNKIKKKIPLGDFADRIAEKLETFKLCGANS